MKEMYLQPHAGNISNEEESSCQLWKLKVPSNIKGFVRKLSYIVCKNLSKRNIIPVGLKNLCNLCCLEVESAMHLFFECRRTHDLWNKCYTWWGDQQVLAANNQQHFWQHVGNLRGVNQKLAW